MERRIVALRRLEGLGPARIAGIVGMHASTVHRVLVRHGVSRLSDLDRTTKEPIRRMEMTRPGELVHVDIKKLGRIPVRWRLARQRARGGARALAQDQGWLRLRAFSGRWLHPSWPTQRFSMTSSASTAAAFWRRAEAYFASHGHHRRTGHHGQRVVLSHPTTSLERSKPPRTPSPGPIGPRPMGRSSDSIEPCSGSGLTSGHGTQMPSAPDGLLTGSTSTTITDTTPPSGAHRSDRVRQSLRSLQLASDLRPRRRCRGELTVVDLQLALSSLAVGRPGSH